ncbi:MAG: Tol-Pal system beta propeller repeat protein TolB [Thiomicrorhabdus chilensis]|uniref:Tol-Pal system beta propeller repeat protein TolB n=1 Tax=Thiomicrorhabdus chilensis TaxID=63656 RepID=UPI001FE09459|nr:Tol-Pal system beta propeller repeat protein TolB [Thiomicrorhabdus chilensis]MDX1347538.1 Tol-Pal system beta propeller repeat protein TolB [Thiomicrorhabdus chilensis]
MFKKLTAMCVNKAPFWTGLLVSVLFVMPFSAQAQLTIEINESYENALPIAIVPLDWKGQTQQPPQDLSEIIRNNLRRSGKFKPVELSQLPARPTLVEEVNFDQWRQLDVDNLLIGKITDQGNDRYMIEMRFLDVLRKVQVIGKRWSNIPGKQLRQIAHIMSDLIYQELTGIKGAFNTQIAYVTLKTRDGKRKYTLEVADADGFNPQPILRSPQPIMSPSWSPDGKKLAYVSFEKGRSHIIVQSLDGKYRETIASYKGINGAPAWSPDGQKMALTLSKDGSADIYVMDMANRSLKRLTRHWSIETEAAWAADGRSLFFNSDRRGQPQIFQVFLDTGEIQRVSFEGRYNANPEISPDGRYLAMVHGQGGFHIGLLDLMTNQFNVLTQSFLDESPTFSPNGEMILYAMNQGSIGKLAVVSVDGTTSQTLSVRDGQVREPAWGPYLNR